ncbi:MAG: malto-oligosyltrehalose trehalohydrolase [Actinomycetota bacterium]
MGRPYAVGDSYRLLTEGTLGAAVLSRGGVRFRVWAPFADRIDVVVDGRRLEMEPEDHDYHAAVDADAGPGMRYGFLLNGSEPLLPDPASRSQPDGVHGLSEVVAPADPPPDWPGMDLRDSVISEVHVGTASKDGTFDGLVEYVDHLRASGFTGVELMPVAEFPGERNWGYDGVFPYAVHHAYGGPEGLRRFVGRCHDRGLAVILDVVYNHVGPEGNVLREFGPYFTDRYRTPWGDAVNFDGPGSDEVRRYFGGSALMWLEEFGVDALRIDAVHGIVDTTARPFLMELAEAKEDLARRLRRPRYLVAETNLNDVRMVTPLEEGGIGMDAQWNDEFHHALHTLVTGERDGYYVDFGSMQDLADTFQRGFASRGRYSAFRRHRAGSDSSHVPPERFVVFAQNHDQIGNRARGDRLASSIDLETRKVVAGLTMLHPGVPLLFQGEEYGDEAPFPYFVSHSDPELVESVRRGRREEFSSFEWSGEPPDPQAEATFESARIDLTRAAEDGHAVLLAWHRELVRLRREAPAMRPGVRAQAEADEGRRVLTVRRRGADGEALLVANLGPEPVTAGPEGDGWTRVLHSADRRWGGPGLDVAGRGSEVEASSVLPPRSMALWLNR